MALLEIKGVCKSYGGHEFITDVNLDISSGDILCLLGPSGCGKTTLLRMISGLEDVDSGTILFDGRNMAGVAPHRRSFGMMFQEFALFPHRNVRENIAFGLEMKKMSGEALSARIDEMVGLTGLGGLESRNVSELSGGEKQRVALARSLAPSPRLLMLDEPLGALDRELKERLMLDLRDILKKVHLTSIFVTHDQAEAFAMADRIAVISNGHVEQVDCPPALYSHPETETVARFLGFRNILDATITGRSSVLVEGDEFFIDAAGKTKSRVKLLIRPEAATPVRTEGDVEPGTTLLRCRVDACIFRGRHYHLKVTSVSGTSLEFEVPCEKMPGIPGSEMTLALDPSAMVVMPG